MLTATKLEKIIELEDNLKSEYQAQLDAKSAEIDALLKEKQDKQATIERQLETITDLSKKAAPNQKIEQQHRELSNRAENLQAEISELKKRAKTLQRDLSEAREELKALKQYDPARMKKNLDANKKKLAEKTSANELLQKSMTKTKAENAELQRQVKELEAKLAELEPETEEETAEEEAA